MKTKATKNGTAPASRRTLLGAALGLGLAAVAGLEGSGAARADEIADIKAAGVLRAGVQVAQVPWGYMDADGHLVGFDIDMVNGFAKTLGVKVDFVPVTPANRIATLLTGKVDLLAAGMGIYPERMKVVQFSRPYCNVDTVYIAKAASGIKSWADLKGLRVGVPRGTPQDIAVTKANTGATIQRFDDDASTVQALMSGQVDVIGAASTQMPNIDRVAGPGRYAKAIVLNRQFNAFAVRPGATALADALNAYVTEGLASGTIPANYKGATGDALADLPKSAADALPVILTQTP